MSNCQECSVRILINHCSLFNRILGGVRLKTEGIRFSSKSSPQDNRVSFKIILFQTKLQWNWLSPVQNKEIKLQVPASFYLLLWCFCTFQHHFLNSFWREEAALCFGVCRNKLRKGWKVSQWAQSVAIHFCLTSFLLLQSNNTIIF